MFLFYINLGILCINSVWQTPSFSPMRNVGRAAPLFHNHSWLYINLLLPHRQKNPKNKQKQKPVLMLGWEIHAMPFFTCCGWFAMLCWIPSSVLPNKYSKKPWTFHFISLRRPLTKTQQRFLSWGKHDKGKKTNKSILLAFPFLKWKSVYKVLKYEWKLYISN